MSSIPMKAKSTATIGETLVNVMTIDVRDHEFLFFAFSVATNALDQFEIRARCLPKAEEGIEAVLATASADYTSPNAEVTSASGNLTAAATSGVHWFRLAVGGMSFIEIYAASVAAGGSTLTMQASGQ